MAKITPTIGRRVWYWTGNETQTQPYDAGIAYVHSDSMINISYADADGHMHACTSVPLWDGEGEKPAGMYCEWMLYQKEQAAKYDGAAPGTGNSNGSPAAGTEISNGNVEGTKPSDLNSPNPNPGTAPGSAPVGEGGGKLDPAEAKALADANAGVPIASEEEDEVDLSGIKPPLAKHSGKKK